LTVRNHLVLGAVGALFLIGSALAVTGGRGISQQGSFLQSGTGATLQTIETKLRQSVNVRDFGALCDGSTNDATALINANTAAVAAGRSILVDCKVRITSAVGTVAAPLKFEGAGSLDLSPVGGSVTVSGSITAPAQQVFYTGSGTLTFSAADAGQVLAQWWGAIGDGVVDETTALQAFLNSGRQNLFITDGTYRITSTITQAPGTTVTFGGGAYLQPDASVWASTYVWKIYDNWNSPSADFMNGQYLRGNRTALYGFRSFPTAPIAATTLQGADGIGIVVQDFRSWGAKNGCIELQAGVEWRLNGSQCVAPPERSATSKGLNDATTDGLIDGFVSEAYPYGMYFTSTSSNNDVFNSHVWGQPAINDNPAWTALTAYTTNMYVKNGGNTYRCTTAGTSASSGGPSGTGVTITDGSVVWTYVAAGTGQGTRALNWGFWFDGGGSNAGGSNRCWGCIADTPERINTGAVASSTNGGIGFYIDNWQNSITGAYVIGTTNLSKGIVINNSQGNSIIGTNIPFDATKFETGGYLVFQGTATALNNEVVGGSFNRDGQLKTGPFWWSPTTGNVFWGSAAVAPGTDANVGIAHNNDGSIGSTRNGGTNLFLNRTTTAGDQIVIAKDGTTFGKIGSNGASTITLTFGSAGPVILAGSGAPEASVTGPIGSIFLRTDGFSGGSAYIKQSGSGNTGWSQISGANRTTPTYGTAVTINVALGNEFVITPTDGVGFTVSSPTNSIAGERITIRIKNSFGVLGALTFGATYKASAWTQPLNGFSRSVDFQYDGTNWIQVSQTGVDVPN
jgi:hypothetical protein